MEGGGGGPPSFYLPPFHRLVNKSSVRKREREKRRVIIKPSRLPKRIQQIPLVPQGQSFHTKGKDIGDFHTGVTDSPAVIRSLRSCCILSSFLPPITSLSLSLPPHFLSGGLIRTCEVEREEGGSLSWGQEEIQLRTNGNGL